MKNMLKYKCLQVFCYFMLTWLAACSGCHSQSKRPEYVAPFAEVQVDSLKQVGARESFNQFLNRILNTDSCFSKQEIRNVVFMADSFGAQTRYSIDVTTAKESLEIKRVFNHLEKPPPEKYDDMYGDCVSYFSYSNQIFNKFPIHCRTEFDYTKQNWVKFGKGEFLYLKTEFNEDCIGTGCLVNIYPIFAIRANNQVDMYCFYNYVDIAGVRFGEINGDGYLDFLEIDGGGDTKEELELMGKSGLESGHFFKIKAVTYKQNKWSRLKDKKGNDLFIFIQLQEALDLNSAFKILSANWLNGL